MATAISSFMNNNNNRPPPSGPPPPYARVVTRVYRNSLRPIVLFVTGVSAVWSIAVAINLFRDLNDEDETGRMKTFDLVVGLLYTVTFVLELFGLYAAATQKLALVKLYIWASALAGTIAVVAGALRLAMHFVLKDDIIRQCTVANTDATVVGPFGDKVGNLTDSGAADYCRSLWNREIWWQIFFILLSLVFGFFFTCIAAAFYHQILDPNSTRNVAPSSQFNLQTFGPGGRDPHFQPPQGPPPPTGYYAGEDVPPYPGYGSGPPKYEGGGGPITPTDEKGGSGGGYIPAHGGNVGRTLEDGGSESTVTLEPPRQAHSQAGRT